MSLITEILRNSVSDFRERLIFQMRIHRHEIFVGAVMTIISIGIAIAATGDFNQALADPEGSRY